MIDNTSSHRNRAEDLFQKTRGLIRLIKEKIIVAPSTNRAGNKQLTYVILFAPQFEPKPESGNTLSGYGQGNDDGRYGGRDTGNTSLLKRQN